VESKPKSDDVTASATSNPPLGEGTENYYTGSEPFFSFFTQAQVILGTLRLTVDSSVVVQSADLSSQMESARRGFQHSGDLVMAIQDVGRISAQFKNRVQSWERYVQERQNNKRQMNGALIQRIKAEAALIRGRVHAIDRALIKLEVTLHQMAGEAEAEAGEGTEGAQGPDASLTEPQSP
jgi:hypothetical protein